MVAPTNFQVTSFAFSADLGGISATAELTDSQQQLILQQLFESSSLGVGSRRLSSVNALGEMSAQPPFVAQLVPPVPGMQPYHPGMQPYYPGVQPYYPGVQPYYPGMQPYYPGMQPYYPGMQPYAPLPFVGMATHPQPGRLASQGALYVEDFDAGMQPQFLVDSTFPITNMATQPQPGTLASQGALYVEDFDAGMQPQFPVDSTFPITNMATQPQPGTLASQDTLPVEDPDVGMLPQLGTLDSQGTLPEVVEQPITITVDDNYVDPKCADTYCTFCKKDFSPPLFRHLGSAHASEEEPYRCKLCPDVSYKKVRGLRRHYESKLHSGGGYKRYCCGHCDLGLSRIDRVKDHMLKFGHFQEGVSCKGKGMEALFDKKTGPNGIQTIFTVKSQYRAPCLNVVRS